jgi:DNA polymerase V
MCPIAKRLGVIPKFEPYFKIKHIVKKYNVVVRSSNYTLYGHVSEQMMNVLATFAENTYVYSIDEAFLKFDNYSNIIDDWYTYGHKIRRTVWKNVRLPIGVGFGSTLTLSKCANHASKKLPSADGVAVIDDEVSRKHILKQMCVSDVWGIGRKMTIHLSQLGIKSAWDLSKQNPKNMRRQFSVNIERTVNELNGIPCMTWDDVRSDKKVIFSTRSLGQRISTKEDLRQELVTHAGTVLSKAIRQSSHIAQISVFAANSPFDKQHHTFSQVIGFSVPTGSISLLSSAIDSVLDKIYHHGVQYSRSGVGALQMVNVRNAQHDLFDPIEDTTLMDCYHGINSKFGKGSIRVGTQIGHRKWEMKREFLSPSYVTEWADIPKINC